MSGRSLRRYGAGLVAACALALSAATPAMAASTHYTGTTSDGGGWIADVPSSWNGTLLLYSHGYGTLSPQDAPPDSTTQAALLNAGYALAGSGYDPNGSLWALGSAVRDQFQTLRTVERTVLPSRPTQVLAFGTSMGGLISALEDQQSNGRLDGALTTCGIVAGGIQLNNYQLDGEYAIDKLLASDAAKLVNYTSPTDAVNAAVALNNAATTAQNTPEGRARLALAMAFMNVTTWTRGQAMPGVYDYAGQEQQQYDEEFVNNNLTLFTETGRQQIELAAGGNGGWDAGVNFARLLSHSSYYAEVHALYQAAGLSLRDDLKTLTQGANIRASNRAIRWLQRTSVPTGRLQVPELDLHTISDQLVPVQQENYYHRLVRRTGSNDLLRQAFVARQDHCNFTSGELLAGVQALQHRVSAGQWDTVALPSSLEAAATGLHLGDAAFRPFWPERLSGDNGPFDPFAQDSRW
jgi:hypothetical protein